MATRWGQDPLTSTYFKSVVDNADYDPLQGFDADVWVLDQGTGSYNLVGRFTSIQLTLRNATMPYIEYNQRVARQLDGVIQIGWMLERGQLDGRVLEQTFGYSKINRGMRINRMPRMQISFQLAAPELHEKSPNDDALANSPFATRSAARELLLTHCKIDSFTIGSNAGGDVIANRWEGLAEGIESIDRTIADVGAYFESVNGLTAYNAAANKVDNPFPWDESYYNLGVTPSDETPSTTPATTVTPSTTNLI